MPESSAILVCSRRADIAETIHRGTIAVVNIDGHLVAIAGDPEAIHFVRSSGKPIQAVAAAETGAFDRFYYTDAQIALAAASHSGEHAHLAEIDATLAKLGLREEHLACGPSYPLDERAHEEMIRAGQPPSRRHHNCSGKHCAMLAAAAARREPIETYWRHDHPHQQRIVRLLAEMAEVEPQTIRLGIDGCGVPTHALPLRAVALAYARLADPSGLDRPRREACDRVRQAMIHYPYLVGGSGRFDTAVLAAGGGKIVCKGGAAGFWAAGVRLGDGQTSALGIALKIEDGDHQAACQTAVEVLDQLGLLDQQQRERLVAWHRVPIKNSRGATVGYSRPEFELWMEP